MSGLDQPLLIANCNYHVGHQMSVRVAEEQGFFREEGLTRYVYESGGLIPGPFEQDGLALATKERGVDIATAVNVDSAIIQRLRGSPLYIVGAWRRMPEVKLYAAPHIKRVADLRGARIGEREAGSIMELFIAYCLDKVGIDAYTDVEWVYHPSFTYRRDPAHMQMLLAGEVDAAQSAPPYSDELLAKGFSLLLDSDEYYPGGRPGKVIVATGQTIDHRAEELRAFLRANIRGFWFVRDPANFKYLRDLERRLRQMSHNEEERSLQMVTDPRKLEEWVMPVTGTFSPEAIELVVEEMVTLGRLEHSVPVRELLYDEPAKQAYRELTSRPELQAASQKALAAERR